MLATKAPMRIQHRSCRAAVAAVTQAPQPTANFTIFRNQCTLSSLKPHPLAKASPCTTLRTSSTSLISIVQTQIQKRSNSHTAAAKALNQKGIDEEVSSFDAALKEARENQVRAPWHREGTQEPPVNRMRSAGAMTKGKLLTTPSRLLKLILPLTTHDLNTDRKDIEPLALLVHPQQPLSYLERLVQSELPTLTDKDGKPKIPAISFKAMESANDEIRPRRLDPAPDLDESEAPDNSEKVTKSDEERQREKQSKTLRNHQLGDGGVESYSGAGREGTGEDNRKFVRWSSSTEIGDFIRDAARAKEFEVDIEGADEPIRVAVPSFNDRTYYLRMRLRKTSKKINDMAGVKKECDLAAHKSAQYVAMGGFGIMVAWWGIVYKLTFLTDLGWDTMEPVTYLVGLSTLMGGYLWFLYHNREVSYRSALNLTISRRQTKLYAQKGFDPNRWDQLIDEGNALRKEIKAVAAEYDVDWDETKDELDAEVTKALKDERRKNAGKMKDEDDDGEDDDKASKLKEEQQKAKEKEKEQESKS